MNVSKAAFFALLTIGVGCLVATVVTVPRSREKTCLLFHNEPCVKVYPYDICCEVATEKSLCCTRYGWECENVCDCTVKRKGHQPAGESCADKEWSYKSPKLVVGLWTTTGIGFIAAAVAGWTWWLLSRPHRKTPDVEGGLLENINGEELEEREARVQHGH
ncbi:hypothetical protein BSKO_03104 [Bryopsis sp. KO-2023]|nr:hypothetical protein BSKO_03104 [Bryopsis sp. KO-2023]